MAFPYLDPDYIVNQEDYIASPGANWGARYLSPVLITQKAEKDAIIGETVPVTVIGTQTEIEITYG